VKRDLELIRLVLQYAETGEPPAALADYTEDTVTYHLALGIEAGLIRGAVLEDKHGAVKGASFQRLTWSGHEFLDVARDNSSWNKITKGIAKTGGAWTLDLLKAYLVAEAKTKFGLDLNLS
jgi:hypothetical protein